MRSYDVRTTRWTCRVDVRGDIIQPSSSPFVWRMVGTSWVAFQKELLVQYGGEQIQIVLPK